MINKDLKSGRESYTYYKKKEGKIDWTEYNKIIHYFIRELKEAILSGVTATLPANLGRLQVVGKRYKVKHFENDNFNVPYDWAATKKLWSECPECAERGQKVYNLNEHTAGVVYKITYSVEGSTHRYRHLYKFKACRTLNRELATKIKAGSVYWVKTKI